MVCAGRYMMLKTEADEGVALNDFPGTLDGVAHELIEDRFLDERAGRARADFPLIQGEGDKAFQGLLVEGVVLVGNIGEENIGGLAAEFKGDVLEI